ncbi:DUF87 domain-containing protein [Paludicola sp. MB14-C6]|uniref:ATP-binding protein n=1 Tax=Paludihabitans sp. MB14-C6 TaxID=3070656 RepID=UPI0027DE2EF3|nr:DUF87 domain-containing protein [Paludicola sp. MB14-C6]WMJ22916.1 DUF87 domain-containing protein [Paludicola sp. MB14-C6]
MKFIVSTIKQYIIQQKPEDSNKTIIRVDGFDDIRIYESLCKEIKKYCDHQNIDLIAKLSYPKFNEAKSKQDNSLSAVIHSMTQNDWIDTQDSLTQYRNILGQENQKKLILLMGTELVEDKGGLHDIYYINSAKIESALVSNYASIFDSYNWDDEEYQCINKLYKWLFELVPVNLYRLSCLADDWNDIDNITMFIEYFYRNLPSWGLCKREEHLPTPKDIIKSQKNLLSSNFDFIERNTFKKLSKPQFAKYNEKIKKYNQLDQPFTQFYEGWANQSIKNYDEFGSVLSDFILGRNINQLRSLLLGVDFAIIESVLGLKLITPKKDRVSVTKVYGHPLEAMLNILFTSLLSVEKVDSANQIEFSFTGAKLVNEIETFENSTVQERLEEAFRNICMVAGGVIDYIARRNWDIGQNEIQIVSSPVNFFTPKYASEQVETGRVTAIGVAQTLNKVGVSLFIKDTCGEILDELNFQWCFSNSEPWLFSFQDILNKYQQLSEDDITSYLMFGTNKELNKFKHLKSEQEFFDIYQETEFNYEDLMETAIFDKSDAGILWKAEFYELGAEFLNFCKALTENGFYGSIDEGNNFIDTYVNLGNKILTNSFAENLKWVLNVYIRAFSIEKNNFSLTRDEECDFCIIPPWHPTILQKLIHQAVFILDGCEQWWSKSVHDVADLSKISQREAILNIKELVQLSCIHQAIDIYPTVGHQYFGNLHTFGSFCICGNNSEQENFRIKDILRKEAVFDDDFSDGEIKNISADAEMLMDVIEDYVHAFPNKIYDLNLAFIDPTDLQPVVSALHNYICNVKKSTNIPDVPIKIILNILVKPENRGGKNYLSYWVNSFFSQDENTDINIYLNEWSSKEDIKKYLSNNTDIVFMMDLLKVDSLIFDNCVEDESICPSECKYPMVFKPTVSSHTSVKRKIELTQTQFEASTVHSRVVYYNNNLNQINYNNVVVVKEVCIDGDRHQLINLLHEKAYWVVCIDGGMDGALLKNNTQKNDYSIIGFTTGKGHHGQYNLTITARESIIQQVKKRFEYRVRNLFKWTDEQAKLASEKCIKEAAKLDGVSLLRAINQNSTNINEFMAYILTSVHMSKSNVNQALNVVVHLDSYRHWFLKDTYNIANENRSRPDFLNISAKVNEDGKLQLSATVIECKIATYSNSDNHIAKAIKQVEHGLAILSDLFKPTKPTKATEVKNDSVRRRYWYAQLYRALAFSQITFHDDTEEYQKLASSLRNILEGDFDIEWNGRVMGYWVDMKGSEVVRASSGSCVPIEVLSIPQSEIQRLILDDECASVEYVTVIESQIDDSKLTDTDLNENDAFNDTQISNNTDTFNDSDGFNYTGSYNDTNEIIERKEETVGEEGSVIESEAESNYDADEKIEEETQEEVDVESPETDIPIPECKVDLSKIKIHIGNDNKGNEINWSFGHSKLSNRHLLITGSSGQGKTYLMQKMLNELSLQGVASMVFDYTEGFRLEQLEPEFVANLKDRIDQKVVYFDGVPVNPFRRQEIEVMGIKAPEKISDVATRIADIFTNVYKFGEQQFSAIYTACKNGLEKYNEQMDMELFKKELENINNAFSKTVLSKLTPFFDSVSFSSSDEFDWGTMKTNNGTLTIFQLTNFVRELQVVITEFMLWDAWYYFKKYGSKDDPFVVVLDEAQNLSHKANSPSAKILTEGRKFGWSAWFATQFLKPQLDDAEINRLQQAAFRAYFKPADNDLTVTAKQLGNTNDWSNTLRGLQKGQCIVAGERMKLNGDFGPTIPAVTHVTPFEENINE